MNQTKLIGIGAVFMILLSTMIVVAVYADLDGPSIYQIDILPVDPVAGDHINIIAYAIDKSGVSNTKLTFTTDGANWDVQDMDFIACLCAAGGRWVGSFGPINEDDVVEFYITAFDSSPVLNPTSSEIFSLEIGV